MKQAKKKTATKAPEPSKASPTPEAKTEAPKAAEPAAPAGGKAKKLPPHLAALRKQQEELKAQQEAEARAVAERQARIAEIEKQEAEEAKRKEEAKALKKQREKEKIEQQKKEGTYLTKAQREEKARNELKLQQMRAAGIVVAGLEGGDAKKKPVYDGKKKGGKKNPLQAKVRYFSSHHLQIG